MTNRFKAFWLGLIILAAIALVSWFVLFLRPYVGDGEVTLTVRFSNIDKIVEGTRVTFGGKQVGQVVKIEEIENPREAEADEFGNLYIYELTLKVDSSVNIYTYDAIIYSSSGLLGEKAIAITPKAPPFGAPPAKDVTNEILYGRSTDILESTLNKLTEITEVFEGTMGGVSSFIETNGEDLNKALKHFHTVAEELTLFMSRANEADVAGKASAASDSLIAAMTQANRFFSSLQENQLLDRISQSVDHLNTFTSQITNREGTIGRLLESDCLYVQLTTVLCQLEAVLYNIQHYGILYQFDRKWQRMNCR